MTTDTNVLKATALSQKHIDLGAKMVPFAGYNMPVQYKGLLEEHHCVRNNVGVFDVSHMGEFWVSGERVLDFLQFMTSNDVSKLFDGKVQYSCMPNDKGGIVDDLLVYKVNDHKYLLVVNASNIDKDWNWLMSKAAEYGVEMVDKSEETSLLAVQGPNAMQVLQKLTPLNLEMEYYTFQIGEFAGHQDIVISTTGYTGAGGYEVYFPNEVANDIWDKIFAAGADLGIQPIGLGARDTLRLEMGFCLYGNDIDDTTSPIEAGLGWITKFTKTFMNSEYIKGHKENGTARKLVGFEMIDKGIPRHGYEIIDAEMNPIGIVTSGTQSPSLSKAIGMGYVPTALAKPGNDIYINIRGKAIKAQTVAIPFYKK